MLPRPWVKWSYEPARAVDVPGAIMRAYAAALQPPAGPVFVSIPLRRLEPTSALGPALVRSISSRMAPDTAALSQVVDAHCKKASRPALVLGAAVDRSGGWNAAIQLAEKIGISGLSAPLLASVHAFPGEPWPLRWRVAFCYQDRWPISLSLTTSSWSLAHRCFVTTPMLRVLTCRKIRVCFISPTTPKKPHARRWATASWAMLGWRWRHSQVASCLLKTPSAPTSAKKASGPRRPKAGSVGPYVCQPGPRRHTCRCPRSTSILTQEAPSTLAALARAVAHRHAGYFLHHGQRRPWLDFACLSRVGDA